MPAFTVARIVDALEKYHQRATYGAVAALVGKPPRSVMQGLPKKWRYSFVVNQETGEPSEYHELQKHPALQERSEILTEAESLAQWLADPT